MTATTPRLRRHPRNPVAIGVAALLALAAAAGAGEWSERRGALPRALVRGKLRVWYALAGPARAPWRSTSRSRTP